MVKSKNKTKTQKQILLEIIQNALLDYKEVNGSIIIKKGHEGLYSQIDFSENGNLKSIEAWDGTEDDWLKRL